MQLSKISQQQNLNSHYHYSTCSRDTEMFLVSVVLFYTFLFILSLICMMVGNSESM